MEGRVTYSSRDISFLSRIFHTNDKDDNHLDLAVSRGNLEIFKKCRYSIKKMWLFALLCESNPHFPSS